MAVLKVWDGTEWRKIGCGGSAPVGTVTAGTRGYFSENGYIFVDSGGVSSYDDGSTATGRFIKNVTGGSTTAYARRTDTLGGINLSSAQVTTNNSVLSIGPFGSNDAMFEYVLGSVPAETGGTVLCSWTLGAIPLPGRLKMWTGAEWAREVCDSDTGGHPLKVWDGSAWQVVACLIGEPPAATSGFGVDPFGTSPFGGSP